MYVGRICSADLLGQTAARRSTLDPTWDETFSVTLPGPLGEPYAGGEVVFGL